MASQNLPGVAAIRSAGYPMPISKLITLTGLATLVLAPFGAFALNLSAITAAICMGEEAHPDKAKRYTAAVVCGALYIAIGLVGAAVTGVLLAFPSALVLAIDRRLGALGHHRRGLAHRAQRRSPPRSGPHHFFGHPQRRGRGRHRLGLLGCGGRRLGAGRATARPSKATAMNILFIADRSSFRNLYARFWK